MSDTVSCTSSINLTGRGSGILSPFFLGFNCPNLPPFPDPASPNSNRYAVLIGKQPTDDNPPTFLDFDFVALDNREGSVAMF